MKPIITAFVVMACGILACWDSAQAQQGGGVAVGFQNHTTVSVLVQGYTIVNGVQRRGQVFMVQKNGGRAFENNVPTGVRFYTVYDANNPSRVLFKADLPRGIEVKGRDLSLRIVPDGTQAVKLEMVFP